MATKEKKPEVRYVVERRDITEGADIWVVAWVAVLAAALGFTLACAAFPNTKEWELEAAKLELSEQLEAAKAEADSAKATTALIYRACKKE